jgi:ech hydrogenase subunit A
MDIPLFLVAFPVVAAVLLLFIRQDKLRRGFGYIAAAVILAVSLYLFFSGLGAQAQVYEIAGAGILDNAMLAIEALIAVYIIYAGVKSKKYYPIILVLLQSAVLAFFELSRPAGAEVAGSFFIDNLALIMAFIIGVIGSLICLHAFGYMRDFHHHHKDIKDRRGTFFFFMFAFLGAMFGLVFSNSITWIYFFWEVTTICSFILIGYTRTGEALNNAFRALTLNLLGGLAFMIAIAFLSASGSPLQLDQMLLMDKMIVLLPATLIGFAALTKSAQLPFSSWLIGAMVAPTPVSALLHSSTMVKAGVYMLIRFAPVFEGTTPGLMLALVGSVTFLLASGIAISQSNAKKVLAYSTIANLGLIVACAGVGSYEAVWAAILLMIFHAAAKSLLFLSVGTAGHKLHSIDIEDMESLIIRMPLLAFAMAMGIAVMFLAPFGMLISKWATLEAFIVANPILAGLVIFGSGITVFFWTKWLGKIIAVSKLHKPVDERVHRDELSALITLVVLATGLCLLFPLVSLYMVEPFIQQTYGTTMQMGQDNLMIMFFMFAASMALPFSMLHFRRERLRLPVYMGGRPGVPGKFAGSAGIEREVTLGSYYMQSMFGEKKLMRWGLLVCPFLIFLMFLIVGLELGGVPI